MRKTHHLTGAAIVLALLAAPAVAQAQHHHVPADTARMRDTTHAMHAMPATDTTHAHQGMAIPSSPLDLSMARMGSGTSWLPDTSPMYAAHSTLGGWSVMLHGVAFLQYDDQGSTRGDRQLGSINWGMAMAQRSLAGGQLALRTMVSAEPFTVGARGYPLLLQSGEAYRGEALHDRQHPHDLFMEIAAQYDRAIAPDLALSLYAAPVGEPAIGPVAFPHRPSAMDNPFAPIGHHWQDATHVAFGVVTAGVYTRTVKLEGSVFNGREPDEVRTNFDYRGRSLDSYAGRVTVNPSARLSLSASYAYMKSPEQLHPDEALHRASASVLYDRPLGASGNVATALIYGANAHAGAPTSNSVLAETNVALDTRNTVFARAELVQKTREDLVIPDDVAFAAGTNDASSHTQFGVGELTLGYVREIATIGGGSLGLGGAGTVNIVPEALRSAYGTRAPVGGALFLRLRPGRMGM